MVVCLDCGLARLWRHAIGLRIVLIWGLIVGVFLVRYGYHVAGGLCLGRSWDDCIIIVSIFEVRWWDGWHALALLVDLVFITLLRLLILLIIIIIIILELEARRLELVIALDHPYFRWLLELHHLFLLRLLLLHLHVSLRLLLGLVCIDI